jgi:phosphopantothenoylcysteine decarboxylase/phosphopantothenate--cysteine ligase
MSRILLGVSGGIAAYKALELIRLATGAGHSVRVVQTPASTRFVGRASFEALTGAPVLLSEFQRDPAMGAFPGQPRPEHQPLSHLALVANADVLLVAPASANTIAKLAAGMADNLLCSCALAAPCPVLVAPAMNNLMYEHPATRANLATLAARGVGVIEPGTGRLASRGEEGVGRLAEPERLLAACEEAVARRAGAGEGQGSGELSGVRVLVTAGGTREPIDSVRFLGNSSSGRMGVALAEAARQRGAAVTLVAANIAVPAPEGVHVRRVATAAELLGACGEEFPDCDILLMAAAVADFTPIAPTEGKLKKSGRRTLQLELAATPDVLAGLSAARREGQTLVGFAAEHGEQALGYARGKLAEKDLDAIVVNDISRPGIGFESDENEVTILLRGGERANGSEVREIHVGRAPKSEVAWAILDAVGGLHGSL